MKTGFDAPAGGSAQVAGCDRIKLKAGDEIIIRLLAEPVHFYLHPPDLAETNLIRAGTNGHSVKPAAFYDLVERISPGPYLDVFGGRNTLRFGWDAWGDGR